MPTQTIDTQPTLFKISWLTLVVLSSLMAINHLILALVLPGEATLFIGWAAFNLYSTIVLYLPFRRGEQWAWYTSWILVVGLASTLFFDASIGVWYLAVASVMAFGLLLTRPTFFPKD